MKTRFLLFGLLAIMAGSDLMACSSEVKLPHLAGNAVILAFGNSLTFGTGAAPTQSYPAALENLIGRRVVNSGIPGEVTGEGLSRLTEELEKVRPDLMILCHGGNDLLRGLDPHKTAENLRAMIRAARERGVAVMMIAVPFPGVTLSPPSLYRKTASEMKIPVDEKSLGMILSKGSLKSDYIHPNAAGYRKLAESIAAFLKRRGALN